MDNMHSGQASRPAFQYDFVSIDLETTASQSMTTKEAAQISAIHKLLVTQVPVPNDSFLIDAFMDKLLESLLHKNVAALRFVCKSLECDPVKKGRLYKPDYAKSLVDWCRKMPLSTSTEDTHFSTGGVLQRICTVIRDTSTPSWLRSVPVNFGDLAAGTIKADEWHSLITIYIPIALISLWGQSESEDHLNVGSMQYAVTWLTCCVW
ncbi:hypothetical protein HD554DRAFT_2260500 [Boletus coccyginus]|nr:hypothetical protein HD554DRAFT_2260500 [Boletus coccyginus]